MPRLAGDPTAFSVALSGLGLLAVLAGAAPPQVGEPQAVVFATGDGGSLHGDLYGSGAHGVVLAHGAVFDKRSWRPLALTLAADGFRVLAFDFRGYGASEPGEEGGALYRDVIAAVGWLRGRGVETIAVIGASMGGRASALAATRMPPGALQKLILLAPAPIDSPEAMQVDRLLFIASQEEPALENIREQYERAPGPKRLQLLPGAAHAQHVFRTEHGEALTQAIRHFLAE